MVKKQNDQFLTNMNDFTKFQKDHFLSAERTRFEWQTTNPLIKKYELILLKNLSTWLGPETRILEVGCGEGANFANMELSFKLKQVAGIEFSLDKINYWLDNISKTEVAAKYEAICADALQLPFAEASFDVVFCRDLLHHITNNLQLSAIKEMKRVCKPGGKVILIESNGRNPIIFLHALLIKAERGELRSSPGLFLNLLQKAGLSNISFNAEEPLPIFRIFLHYKFGKPAFANKKFIAKFFKGLDILAAKLLPKKMWAYCIVTSDN